MFVSRALERAAPGARFALQNAGIDRIENLARCSPASARRRCDQARLDDTLANHSARLALAAVFRLPLRDRYLSDLVHQLAPQATWNEPATTHACALAILSPGTARIPIPDLTAWHDRAIERAFGLRLGRVVRDDDEIRRLSIAEAAHHRRIACEALAYRDAPGRLASLARLMNDADRSVRTVAASACMRNGQPATADLLMQHGDMFHLRLMGDPRARPVIASLVASENPDDADEAITCALRLGDRDLLTQLWTSPDWYTQRRALLGAVKRGLLAGEDLCAFVDAATADQLAELLVHWPESHWPQAAALTGRFLTATRLRPDADADVFAAPVRLRCALIRTAHETRRTDLVGRCLSDGGPELRAGLLGMIGVLGLLDRFEMDMLTACIDRDAEVAGAAIRVIVRTACLRGLFGLDTAMMSEMSDHPDARKPLPRDTLNLLTPSL